MVFKKRSREVVASGEDVYLTLDTKNASDDTVYIGSRKTASPFSREYYQKGARELHIHVSEGFIKERRKARLAVDAYLRIGQYRSLFSSKPLILIGGAVSDHGVNIEILVFKKGALIDVSEKAFPPVDQTGFEETLNVTLEMFDKDYPDAIYEQVAPLERLPDPRIKKYWSDRYLKIAPMTTLKKSAKGLFSRVFPLFLVLIPLLGLAYILNSELTRSEALAKEAIGLRSKILASHQKTVGIEINKARAAFKNHIPATEKQVEGLFTLISALKAIPKAQVMKIVTPGKKDVELELTIQLPAKGKPLEQGYAIIELLAARMPGSISIPLGGYQDSNALRRFRIEVR